MKVCRGIVMCFRSICFAILLASFPSLPPTFWVSIHSTHRLIGVVLTGALQVGYNSVAMVTSLPLRRSLPSLLLPHGTQTSILWTNCFNCTCNMQTYLISRHKLSTRSRLFRRDSDFFENGGFFVSEHSV